MKIGSATVAFFYFFLPVAMNGNAWAALSVSQSGLIEFDSVNIDSSGELINRDYDTSPVTIRGALTFPDSMSGPVPAVVLGHGTSGLQNKHAEWAQFLNDLGLAVFVVDSYGPRDINETQTDSGGSLNAASVVADLLNALELLSSHPDIDANRIAVMGNSVGGYAARTSAFEEARSGVLNNGLQFAAHISMYSNCNVRHWSANTTGAPFLFLYGAQDDWTPASACANFADELRGIGADVTMKTYANAHHGFDNSPGQPGFKPGVKTRRNCAGEFRLDTRTLRRYDIGEVFSDRAAYQSYIQGCTARGATARGDERVRRQAQGDVLLFLAENLGVSPSQPDRIFDWAESIVPQYIAPAGAPSLRLGDIYYRYYEDTNSYLGVSDGHLYYLAPDSDPAPIDLGDEVEFLAMAIAAGF